MPRINNESNTNTDNVMPDMEHERYEIGNTEDRPLTQGIFVSDIAAARPTPLNTHTLSATMTSNVIRGAEPAFDFVRSPISKSQQHEIICHELESLYERKNQDYGDSFGNSYDEYGMTMAVIRLSDKLNRLKQLARNGVSRVVDESIEDTLMDLANYSIMTIIELHNHH